MNDILKSSFNSSPVSTAGTGYRFEYQVQAFHLFKFIESYYRNHGGLIRLQFQTEHKELKTDDLLCTYFQNGKEKNVLIGCKINMAARVSDKAFHDAFFDAWSDYANGIANPYHLFRPDSDYIGFAFSTECNHGPMRVIEKLIGIARNSNNGDDFSEKCRSKKDLGVLDRIYRVISSGGNMAPAKFLWHFLTRLKWMPFTFDGDNPGCEDIVINSLVARGTAPEIAPFIWHALVQNAAKLSGNKATLDFSNIGELIEFSVLKEFSNATMAAKSDISILRFPWGAPLRSEQEYTTVSTVLENWEIFGAAQVLNLFRSIRVLCWSGRGRTDDMAMLASKCASDIDSLKGDFDDKATLVLFTFLNSSDESVHWLLVQWAIRCADGPFIYSTCEVEWTLRSLYAHYYGADAGDGGRVGKLLLISARERIRRITNTPFHLFAQHAMWGEYDIAGDKNSDNFDKMRWTIGDNNIDYRHPECDTSAFPGTTGVVTFEALLGAVRGGSVGHMLCTYHLCTTEATFERLLNIFSELSLHVKHQIQYISANDTHILSELRQLLDNSVAGNVSNYIKNKLVVLPIQSSFPFLNDEVINIPFRNISLVAGFEEIARAEHEALADDSVFGPDYDSRKIWGFETVYADVMLAMTLRAKLFANSRSEANFANLHGVGVSRLQINPVFYD